MFVLLMAEAAPLPALSSGVVVSMPVVLLWGASVAAMAVVLWRHQLAIEILERGDEPEPASDARDAPRAFGGGLYPEPTPSPLAELFVSLRAQPLRAAIAAAVLFGFAAVGVLLQSSSAASSASAALATEAAALRAANDSLVKALAEAKVAVASVPAPVAVEPRVEPRQVAVRATREVARSAPRRALVAAPKVLAPVLPPAPVLTGSLP